MCDRYIWKIKHIKQDCQINNDDGAGLLGMNNYQVIYLCNQHTHTTHTHTHYIYTHTYIHRFVYAGRILEVYTFQECPTIHHSK